MQRLSASSGEGVQYAPLKPGFQESEISYVRSTNPQRAIQGWPSEARTLKEASISWPLRLGSHLALLSIPIGSIVLGVAVARTNGTAESPSGNKIMQAMAVTATLWPILFAAVLGPMLKAAALHRAERGVKLGLLELLFTSQTLVNTVRGCFTLRTISAWSIILVVMWSLSPVGGQGALRALSLKGNTTSYEYPMIHYPIDNLTVTFRDGPFNAGNSGGASLINQFRAPIGAVFSTQDIALLHSGNYSQGFQATVERLGGMQEGIKITQRDLWRNVRIPFLHMLEGYNSQNAERWLSVSNDSIAGYSSLIGIPVRGVPSTKSGNSSFSVKTNYQVLDCKPWLNATDWIDKNNGSVLYPTDNDYIQKNNQGLPNIQLNILSDQVRTSVPNTPWGPPSLPRPRMKLVFRARYNLTICDVRTEHVESGIQCARDSQQGDLACRATKVRRVLSTPELTEYENITALDVGRNMIVVQYLPYTLASNHPLEPSFLERWLKNPPNSFLNTYDSTLSQMWYEDVPLNIFSNRLSVALNTYLQAAINTTCIFGSDGTSLEARDETWDNTTGTWTEFTAPVYQLHKVWFSLYIISAAVLTIAALFNILLRIRTRSPDFLNSVSALTRDSAFIQVPTPASTLEGSDRARLLRDTWVMIQDVRPDGKVGRIALSDAVEAVALRKDREYM